MELAELIQMYLHNDGIESEIVGSAIEGITRINQSSFDLILLDINLPGMDGFEFLQEARPVIRAPIVIISARESDEDIIMGLSAGADEFVTKPFTPRVLVARIRALLRRSKTNVRQAVAFGPFVLDMDGYILTRDNVRIKLSSKEFEVLRHLVINAGRAIPPQQVYSEVWKTEYGDTTKPRVIPPGRFPFQLPFR